MPVTPFNSEKAIAAILYISSAVKNIRYHQLLKIIYFADLKHIAKYGRSIFDDRYVAMKDGPIPSKIYDLLKDANNQNIYFEVSLWKSVTPKQKPEIDEFSKSDLICLDESIAENKDLPWDKIREKSHDKAWDRAWNELRKPNQKRVDMPKEDVIAVSGVSETMLAYMKQSSEYA